MAPKTLITQMVGSIGFESVTFHMQMLRLYWLYWICKNYAYPVSILLLSMLPTRTLIKSR